jgi:nucleotide-binding universal stress UspA family protein
MTARPGTSTWAPVWEAAGRPVCVGVDGSWRNRAAIDWALRQADATARPLDLVGAVPVHDEAEDGIDEHHWASLDELAARLRRVRPGVAVRRVLSAGGAVPCLLARSGESALLVVGKRGAGTFSRLFLGSTSLGVAARSMVPVAIVPDIWHQEEHEGQPVMVGLDPYDVPRDAMQWAFAQARRRGVELLAVHAFSLPALAGWDLGVAPFSYAELAGESQEALTKVMAEYAAENSDVPVRTEQHRGHPADVLLREAGSAQLLVLGRHPGHFNGFPWGSVARGVLHYAELPVVLVPAPAA